MITLASEAWIAWQDRLAKLNLTSEQKEQATAVLIKLMKVRAERQAATPDEALADIRQVVAECSANMERPA